MGGSFTAYAWLQLLALGGMAGALGQGVRTIVGLKKLHDAASGTEVSTSDIIALDRLLVSLAIGFIAGALAGAATITDLDHVSGQQILALAGAGYAGADFIEGFMSRVAPAAGVSAGQESVGVAGATTATAAALSPAAADDGAVG